MRTAYDVSATQPNGKRVSFVNRASCPETSTDEEFCRRVYEQAKSSPQCRRWSCQKNH